MYSYGITINLNDFQSERIDVTYPFDIPPTEQGYNDAVFWVKSRLQSEIDAIVQRERARDNYIDPPRVLPSEDAAFTLPPAVGNPDVSFSPTGENINPNNEPVIIPSHIPENDTDVEHSAGNK